MSNDITHEAVILQTPEYVPAEKVDNTQYNAAHADRFTIDGKTINVKNNYQMSHYHSNMAAYIQIGKWLDYLRENGVYDNTRIIIVADHGKAVGSSGIYESESFKHEEFSERLTAESYYPLLMVKDFNSEGFNISDEFMTNADVPTLATQGLISNPVNPFTGKPINSDEKYAHDQIVIMSTITNVRKHDGNTFLPAMWASVSDNLHDQKNWAYYEKETVLKEHKLP